MTSGGRSVGHQSAFYPPLEAFNPGLDAFSPGLEAFGKPTARHQQASSRGSARRQKGIGHPAPGIRRPAGADQQPSRWRLASQQAGFNPRLKWFNAGLTPVSRRAGGQEKTGATI